MKTKLFITTLILFGINFLNAQQWTTMAPMPTPRNSAGAAVIGNTIYVIGGSTATTTSGSVEAYDTTTNTWSIKSSLNTVRSELVVASVNGKIYAIGGYNGSSAVNTIEEYNPATNTWTTKANMPTARSVMSGSVVNNQIYVVGGWPGNIATLEVYDPITNNWTTKASCTQARQQINGAVGFNGKLYFMGGKNNIMTSYYQTNESYEPATNMWLTQANLPISRWAGAAINYLGEIHYLGGSTGGTYQNSSIPNFDTHYIYNTTSNTWSTGLPMLSKRSRHVVAVVGTSIYVIGGLDEAGNVVGLNERYDNSSTNNCPTLNGTLANGLVAYYPFCGNANDASGNNYDGIVNGATLTADRFGNTNAAYSFNGTNNFITVPNVAIQNNASRTTSFWFNSNSTFGGMVIATGSGSNQNGATYNLRILDEGYLSFMGGNFTSCCYDINPTTGINIKDGNWHNCVVTYEANVFKFYVDGILISSSNLTISTNGQTNYIGKSNDMNIPNSAFFNGKIDDVGIWNRALSSIEISNLYNSNLCYESVSVTDTLIINTGILSYNPITYNNTITIYPNPANDHITIDCGTLSNVIGYHIEISNTVGQILFNQPMNAQQYNVALNSWSGNGIYFVRVFDAQNNVLTTRKIILQ